MSIFCCCSGSPDPSETDTLIHSEPRKVKTKHGYSANSTLSSYSPANTLTPQSDNEKLKIEGGTPKKIDFAGF